MPDQESITLELDPRSVLNAINQANKAVEGWEKGTVGAGDRMQKALERMGEMLIKLNDRSYSSMERLTQSIEKQAAAYGKTGVERLIAERDRLIKKLGDEQAMVQRVTQAYDQMIKIEQASSSGGGGGSGFSARYAIFGLKDIAEGRTKFAVAEVVNELLRLSGTAALIGGVAVGIVGIGVAAYEVVKTLKEVADMPEKIVTEFAKLNDADKAYVASLKTTNDRLENAIAKLEHKPANGLKTAIDEAAESALKLNERLNNSVQEFVKFTKENSPNLFQQFIGNVAGTGPVQKLVEQFQKELFASTHSVPGAATMLSPGQVSKSIKIRPCR